jgi:actin-related protein
VFDAIRAMDPDMHEELFKNVLLSGGSTLFPGLQERLQKELDGLTSGSESVQVRPCLGASGRTLCGSAVPASPPSRILRRW